MCVCLCVCGYVKKQTPGFKNENSMTICLLAPLVFFPFLLLLLSLTSVQPEPLIPISSNFTLASAYFFITPYPPPPLSSQRYYLIYFLFPNLSSSIFSTLYYSCLFFLNSSSPLLCPFLHQDLGCTPLACLSCSSRCGKPVNHEIQSVMWLLSDSQDLIHSA